MIHLRPQAIRTILSSFCFVLTSIFFSPVSLASNFEIHESFRLSDGGVFQFLENQKVCGYRSVPEYRMLTGANSVFDAPLRPRFPMGHVYIGVCKPPNHIKYFGYYANAMTGAGSIDGDYMLETKDHNNLVWIAGISTIDTLAKLKKAKRLGQKAVVVVNKQFFDHGNEYIWFREQVKRWQSFAKSIAPYLSTIVAFYPIDEPYLQIVSKNRSAEWLKIYLESVADIIRSTHTDKPIAIIQSYVEILRGYVPPANFDWYGIDCYGSWDHCGDNEVGRLSIPEYYSTLSQWVGKNKKFILLPDSHVKRELYSSTSQSQVIERAARYARYAVTHPRVVAITPFIYQSICDLPDPNADRFDFYDPRNKACFRGVSAMPVALEYYRTIGKSFSGK